MTFETALRTAGGTVAAAFRPGKQALKAEHRDLVRCKDSRRFTGGVDLDAALALQPGFEESNRWDYGLGYRLSNGSEAAIWVEVHPAHAGEVDRVIDKLKWLQGWLRASAPALRGLTQLFPGSPFVWLATGAGTHIPPHTPQARRLAQAGLGMPKRRLELP